jgi:hypothetical protein
MAEIITIGDLEREMVFSHAKLNQNQKNIIGRYSNSLKIKAMLTGIVLGAIIGLMSLLLALLVVR